MLDAIKQLLDSNVINEDTSSEIMEAWDSKLNEAREQLRTELREEFAQRHAHDKKVMVEALDKMITEGLSAEIAEFNEEKKALAEDRVKFNKKMNEHSVKFNNFMTAKLAEEIKELRKDRKIQTEGLNAVEAFVAKQLAKEVREFAQDKKDVLETKVKLVAEARTQLKDLKARFVKESAAKVQNHVKTKLSSELTALQEDIKSARENSFGRRIFEAFSSEFTSTHLNENAEIRKLKEAVAAKDAALKESAKVATKLKALTESKNREIRMITESNQRTEILTDLLGPLNAEKREIMSNLLESVQTSRLTNAFEKYLPAVLANKAKDATPSRKTVVTESRKAVTGDKVARVNKDDTNIIDIKTLAGLK
jgi:uncharacterized Fe-S cluster-containing radical SAM superfamily protein